MESVTVPNQAKLTLRRKFAAVLLVVLCFALVVEGGARLLFLFRGHDPVDFVLTRHDAGMIPEGRYVSAPFMPFDLRPSSDHEIIWTPPPWPELAASGSEPHVWRIHHNRWGFRGPEVTMAKPENTFRVVCLGGSTTYDTTTDGRTWPEKLERQLKERYLTTDVQVLNFGMNAGSLPFQLSKFALLGVHFEPDLVIIYPGHNDLWAGLGLEGFRPDYSHRLGHWDDSRRSLQRFVPGWAMRSVAVTGLVVGIDRLRGIQYDLVSHIWRNARSAENDLEGIDAFQRGLVTLQGMARSHGAESLVITPFWAFRKGDRAERLISSIQQVAEDKGLPLLDAAHLIPDGDASLVVDDIHFSDNGGSVFASLVAEFIVANKLLE